MAAPTTFSTLGISSDRGDLVPSDQIRRPNSPFPPCTSAPRPALLHLASPELQEIVVAYPSSARRRYARHRLPKTLGRSSSSTPRRPSCQELLQVPLLVRRRRTPAPLVVALTSASLAGIHPSSKACLHQERHKAQRLLLPRQARDDIAMAIGLPSPRCEQSPIAGTLFVCTSELASAVNMEARGLGFESQPTGFESQPTLFSVFVLFCYF
ncbi:hypothetical protein D1007_50487 [Hordeum vulgare]|uniref:Predicted protein n=1 Tax=Hordeum vulgare subsp. vulgare TaxID=112509 RepID=F2DAS6_HORVV|nr:uncharacterized protein LOC123448502 [Hordeum vulgare subsp. vulgare]KAE8776835.1 hypothetical protein D1007_50487 [Hordeum vulgare]BAJ92197.1 predicted protein [Hordeum vulgare subsp. vulgare]